MAFKKKLYKVVGKDKKIHIPRPPDHATHVHLKIGKLKAIVPIIDFDVLWDSSGWFHYLRMDKSRKVIETYKGKWFWTGRAVKGIEKLLD